MHIIRLNRKVKVKKLNNNHSGFGIIEGLLIVIAVLLVGFIGWFVYDRNKTNTETPSASTTTSPESSDTNATQPPAAADETKYVTISPWDVKIAEEYVPSGFTYEKKSATDSHIVFNSTALKAAGCTLEGYGFIVVRGKASDTYNSHAGDKMSYKEAYDGTSGFKMETGGYYYFDNAGLVCDASQEELAAHTEIWNALEKMESM